MYWLMDASRRGRVSAEPELNVLKYGQNTRQLLAPSMGLGFNETVNILF